MNKKNSDNPFNDLQRQLEEVLKQFPGGAAPSGFSSSSSSGPETQKNEKREDVLQKIRTFSMKPRAIKRYLDRFVVKQDEAKKVLSVAVCDHYNQVRRRLEGKNQQDGLREYQKQNILLLGPTGVGKTYLMRNIARLIGVPFVKGDATKFTETGYVGGDVDDLVRDLVKAAGGDVELAQYGIVYLDEIDKIARPSNMGGGKDVSGRGVQINLLKLMEDATVPLVSPTDVMGQMRRAMTGGKQENETISTANILFIVSGAFDKLEEIIGKRLHQQSIGFSRMNDREDDPHGSGNIFHQVASRDLVDYGFEPEFVGRLPVRVACDPLDASDLESILSQSEGSLIHQYQDDLDAYGIEVQWEDGVFAALAALAVKENTGARGLMTVMERLFRGLKFELPDSALRQLSLTREWVDDPEGFLRDLSPSPAQEEENLPDWLTDLVNEWATVHQLEVHFTHDVAAFLQEKGGEDPGAFSRQWFKDFPYGLKLIARNTGKRNFTIDRETVENPEKVLSQWVVASFKEDPNNA